MNQQQIVDAVGALAREVSAAQRQVQVDARPRFMQLRAKCGSIGHVWGVDSIGFAVRCCVVCGEPAPAEAEAD